MDEIKNYLKEKATALSFVELKASASKNEKALPPDLPIPILTSDLAQGILKETFEEQIDFKAVMKGIIYLLGADRDFVYAKDYQAILRRHEEEAKKLLIFHIHEAETHENLEDLLIFSSAYAAVFPEDKKALFFYALALEKKAWDLFQRRDKKWGHYFLTASDEHFHAVLSLDEEDGPTLYKLGHHAKYRGEYIRAKIFFEKFLKVNEDEALATEIKVILSDIADYVTYEEGYQLVFSGKSQEGLDKLEPLYEKYKDWWHLSFVLGLAYRQMEYYDEAIEALERALLYSPDNVMAMNELAICKASIGLEEEALAIFEKAIALNDKDAPLYSNRAMLHLTMKNFEAARKDVETALSLDSHDEIAMAIKNQLNRIN